MPRLSQRIAPVPTLAILIENNELGEVAVKPSHKRKPIPARSIVTDARAAVLAFLGEMAPDTDNDFLAFGAWSASYKAMMAEKGWPPLSDKSLSQTMQVIGCDRKQVEARRKGRGRYIAFRVPAEMGLAA